MSPCTVRGGQHFMNSSDLHSPLFILWITPEEAGAHGKNKVTLTRSGQTARKELQGMSHITPVPPREFSQHNIVKNKAEEKSLNAATPISSKRLNQEGKPDGILRISENFHQSQIFVEILSKLEINSEPEGFCEIHDVLFVTQVFYLSV